MTGQRHGAPTHCERQMQKSLICDGYGYRVDKMLVTGNFLALLKWVNNLALNCTFVGAKLPITILIIALANYVIRN
jgi:hypothetical protein